MRYLRYKIEITVDPIREWKKVITEVYFPTCDMFMNEEAVFFMDKKQATDRMDAAKDVEYLILEPRMEPVLDILVKRENSLKLLRQILKAKGKTETAGA